MNYQEIQNYIKCQKPFDIRDYIDDLIPTNKRERSKYFCPICDNHNLHVGQNGEWQCWNQPDAAHRREIIVALTGIDYRELYRNIDYVPGCRVDRPPRIYPIARPVCQLTKMLFTGNIDLARLRILKAGKHLAGVAEGVNTYYYYSTHQRAVRVDQADGDKYFYYEYLIDRIWQLGKGTKSWHPYGIHQLIQANRVPIPIDSHQVGIVIVEGQKCVDLAHRHNIAAVCLEGGDYHYDIIHRKLAQISGVVKDPILICLPDNDSSGIGKMLRVQEVAKTLEIPSIVIPPNQLIENPHQGDDIEQFIAQCQNSPIEALANCIYRSSIT